MIIYSSSVEEFKVAVDENRIASNIEAVYIEKLGKRPTVSEWRSWNNSMQFMERVIRNSKVADDCGVMIEYNIPSTSKRVDFIIAGKDAQSNDNFIIVELKQWEEAWTTDKEDIVRTSLGGSKVETTHPSYQAWSYRQFMYDMNEAVYTKGVKGHSIAFLHNYKEKNPEPLKAEQYQNTIKEAPLFFAHEIKKLQDFIFKYVGKGKGMQLLYDIENGKIVPSKSLIDHINALFEGHSDFVLLDEQKIAYETIMSLATKQETKKTIIVKGGPGTGKSVVSMNALGGLIRKQLNTKFVAPNASFRNVMVEMLTKQSSKSKMRTKSLFMGSGSFVDARPDEFDAILVDEAHRLKGKGAYMYRGLNQIDDIIKSSRVNVFFIDDYQRIRPDDIGTVEEIKRIAKERKSEIYEYSLVAQFRCSGAEGFLNWVDDALQIRDTGNFNGWDKETFDFRVIDSPHRLLELIKEKQSNGHKARMVAGFAWSWTDKAKGNPNGQIEDVTIEEHDFSMPWNGHVIRETWAIHPDGIDQAGCVHTTQGLEFDYVGVIIGNDLKYNPVSGTLTADYNEYKDTTGKKGLKNKPDELVALIKNIYKVLISRGMKGCYVYCRDEELLRYLQERLDRTNRT
ncbi:DUF2075 domain-containing protein [Paenibacillus methanolicus]|uniref:Schlafen group 3-like DNA/RNA helicase domain-containing protein n=1 Tax=Paenibacillus methanolicus TaxID=582686 RepID=A0A5S5BR33_9BACL|nr:DUF2075 domain-containing protein [Paenibacillus methanolicus]TYP69631.1 hypothetical protein BCM02_114148 [Paenibacillus methanolicus]